jgi:UDP-N-acetylmuramoylalanine--D-glutamate ligase
MKPALPASAPDKPVAVLGLGRTGRAACRLLLGQGFAVEALDSGTGPGVESAALEMRQLGVPSHTGESAAGQADRFSWAVLSPGIDPQTPLVRAFTETGATILSEIELAWRCRTAPVIAITGTNGKTTTTGLIEHLLVSAGRRAVACGNIGRTFSEAILENADAEFFVVEVSSFQLEACSSFAPKVAVWTNFSANHLDRYRDCDEYFEAKARIFLWQTDTDTAVHQFGTRLPESIKARTITFSATSNESDFTLRDGWICRDGKQILEQSATRLPGIHNAENLMAALAAVNAVGIEICPAPAGTATYEAPAHRCEPVREIDGVLFINDSKSTNLDALEKAIRSQNRPLVLIAGGKDKGFDFAPLKELALEKIRHAVLIGQMRDRIAKDWEGVPCVKAENLPSAVQRAKTLSEPGGVVLFSPGTSSFDMFRDYEERGEKFREAVQSVS